MYGSEHTEVRFDDTMVPCGRSAWLPPGPHAAPFGAGTSGRQLHFFFHYPFQAATTTPSASHWIR